MIRYASGILILTLLIGCGKESNTRTPMSTQQNSPIIPVEADDPEMVAAMQKARDSFAEFWMEVSTDYRRPIPALELAMVKVYFADADAPKEGEHMWVAEVVFRNGKISGILTSSPQKLKSVKVGQSVSFPLEQLSDWFYVVNGKVTGAFTVQLLRSRMTPAERAAHDQGYPFRFE